MTAATIRTGAALVGFFFMIVGIGMQSIPWALTIGGVVVLSVAIVGEMRSK